MCKKHNQIGISRHFANVHLHVISKKMELLDVLKTKLNAHRSLTTFIVQTLPMSEQKHELKCALKPSNSNQNSSSSVICLFCCIAIMSIVRINSVQTKINLKYQNLESDFQSLYIKYLFHDRQWPHEKAREMCLLITLYWFANLFLMT